MIDLAGRRIGPGEPVFVIAEAGVNHNGDLMLAQQLVDAAVGAKADAVKFQTFRAERLVSPAAPKAAYQAMRTDSRESQFDMLRRLELPPEAFVALQAHCQARRITFLSTPFDEESVELLDALGVPAIKIASSEVTNLPLLERVARTGKPVILSTGMSTMDDVDAAVHTLRRAGAASLVLLHCVSAYPADPADANLRALEALRRRFDVPVGYSDHTPGTEVALAAVALGACVIEKHLTLDRTLPGPDHQASLEPGEFAALVRGIRIVESSLGDGTKDLALQEIQTAAVARKSLVADRHIQAGTRLTEELIAFKRPGTGLAPRLRGQLIGKIVKTDIPAGTVLTWDMLE